MSNDYRLLQEALDTFNRLKHWSNPDYYREHVMPTVRKIKDRLAVIETDIFLEGKKLAYENFKKENPQVKNFKQIEELDTIPNKLMEATSNFGVFTDNLKSEYCKNDPLAPHRYMKDLSQAMGRYVCACEFWEPKK